MSVGRDVADRRAVEVANTAFYTAVETADLDLLGAVWAEDGEVADGAEIECVHPGWPTLHGRGPVLRSFAVILANTPYIQFFLTDVRVTVAGDTALLSCVENILTGIGDADGASGTRASGAGAGGDAFSGGTVVTTNLFRRTPGGWRLWVHHASPVLLADDEADDEQEVDGGHGERGSPGERGGPGERGPR